MNVTYQAGNPPTKRYFVEYDSTHSVIANIIKRPSGFYCTGAYLARVCQAIDQALNAG